MAKQLNIDLNLKANTQQAKQAIMELQTSLSKISVGSAASFGISPEKMKEASTAARELSIHLNNAFNAQTGKLDLSKLDKSLKTSSTNVTELSSKLLSAGTQGQQAFVKLAQTISAAERPVVSLNSKLSGMFTTLKNTARWQISSSILHGFMSAYSQAMGYVKDLNKSLTDIRIVTGKSIEDMAQFAGEANKAAKALSTTTNEYAKASLIFYQQGLNEDEVAKRTEVTIKMANAAGQSAEVISDQLTAVWNNFYDGSKSLEYYADVMTALGAATASSTDEIAGGLEKFAAVADTIGLSYEYAASALATITSNTRQSEEVVGTALKTIFARIQGLKLGETLEDGLDLNKYSEALKTVGVDVLDATGELRRADEILTDMAARWDDLSKAEQVAMAQAVGGIRQYNQIVALMDNWDNGDNDSMMANLDTATNSTGALQEQADIYAESWEAARDRVQASLEAIYGQVLDDEFFIDIANGFSSLIDGIGAFIDGVGGIKTVLMGIGSIFLTSVANKIQPALMNLAHNFTVVFSTAEQQSKKLAQEMNQGIADALDPASGHNFNDSHKTALQNAMALNTAKAKLQAVENNLTEQEKQQAQQQLAMIQMQQEETQAVADRITKLKEEKDAILDKEEASQLSDFGQDTAKRGSKEIQGNVDSYRQAMQGVVSEDSSDGSVDYAIEAYMQARDAAIQYQDTQQILIESTAQVDNAFRQMGDSLDLSNPTTQIKELNTVIQDAFGGALQDLEQRMMTNASAIDENAASFTSFRNQIDLVVASMPKAVRESEDMQNALQTLFKAKDSKGLEKALTEVKMALKNSKIEAKDFSAVLKEVNPKRYKELEINAKKTKRAIEELKNKQKEVNQQVEDFNPKHMTSKIENITKTAAGLGSVAMAAQSVRSVFQAWSNDDMSFGEKLITTFTALPMILSSASNAFKSFDSVLNGGLSSIAKAGMAQMAYNKSLSSSAAQELKAIAVKRLSGEADEELVKKDLAKIAVKKGLCTEEQKELFIEQLLNGEKGKSAIATMMETAAVKLNTAAQGGNKLAKLALAAAEGLASVFGVTLTTTKTAETGAVIANTAAWYTNPVMWIALVIVGVVAALAALVAAIVAVSKALSDAYNADAIAAEKAEQAAKDLAKSYEEAKQAYEDMIAAMDEYEGARKSLEELTKGTDEYKEALQDANRAALELINTYPHLFKTGDYAWKDGQLIINEDAMARAKAEGASDEAQSYAAMQMGNAEAKQARNKADETELRRKMAGETATTGDNVVGAALGAKFLAGAVQTAVTVAIPAIGPVLGAVIGKVGGAALGMAATNAFENKQLEDSDAINKMIKLYQEDGEAAFELDDEILKEKLQIEDDAIIDALKNNKDAIIELSNNIEAQSEFEKSAARESTKEIIESSGYADSKYADDMVNVAANKFQETQTKKYDELLEMMSSKAGLKAGAKSYFDDMGISSKTGFEVGKYNAKKGTVSYSYLDEQGERQEKEVTAMQISQHLAVAEAEKAVIDACGILSDTFRKLDADSSNLGEGMKKFLSTGDSTQLTKDQYDAIKGMSNDELLKYLENLGINEDNVGDLGYDDMADFINSLELEKTGKEWDNYKDITSVVGSENITLAGAENIQTALSGITDFFGQEVSDQILQMSATMANGLDDATKAEFWNQLGEIDDYTDAEAWEGLLDAMKESGDLTEDETKALEDYIDAAKLAANATKELDFNELAESVGKLRDVMKNISEGAREISDEEYAALEENGIDTSKFAKTIDGYRYLGDSADIVGDIAKGIQQKFEEAEQNFMNIAENAAQASQNLKDAEAELEKARNAAKGTKQAVQEQGETTRDNALILSNMIKDLLEKVGAKLKTIWDGFCSFLLSIYDFLVNTINSITTAISTLWNGLIDWIENTLNKVLGKVVDLLELIGVDTSSYEGIDLSDKKMDPTQYKTSDEIAAEDARDKSEDELIQATQDLANAMPTMTDSIESSADYMSEALLQSKADEASKNYDQAQKDYEDAKATYGEDSAQAQYYEQLVAYYEAQMGAYEKALKSKAWGEVIAEGIDTGEMEAYMDLLEQTNPKMKDLYETTEEYEEALLSVATTNKKMEKGVKSLSSNWEDWDDIMSDSSSSAEDISTILPDINDALQDVLDLDTTEFAMLPPDFARKHWDLISDVVNGVEGAVDELRNVAGEEILLNIDGAVDADGNLKSEIASIHESILAMDDSEFTVGVAIDPEKHAEFIANCESIIAAAGMTAEQAQGYFKSLGYDVELEEVKAEDQPMQTYKWYPLDEEATAKAGGIPQFSDTPKTVQTSSKTEGTAYAIKSITPTGSYGGGVGVNTTAPKTSQKSPSSSGGGGSEPKKAEPSKKSDVVDRYKEINDKIEDSERAMDRASKAADRLWGAARIKAMKEANKALLVNIENLKQKKREALENLKIDQKLLEAEVRKQTGLTVQYDENNNISNYDDILNSLWAELEAAEKAAGDTWDEAEQEKIDGINERIEAVKEAIAQYDDTNKIIKDLDDQIQDEFYQWQDNNAEILSYQLELKIEISDRELQKIDFMLKRIEDDFYSLSEAAALMVGEVGDNGQLLAGGQYAEYTKQLKAYEDQIKDLEQALANEEISPEAYAEGLQEIYDGIYDQLGALDELDKAMMNYYGDTIQAAQEEMSKYTRQMEHHNSVLEHYSSIMKIMGKQNDFKAMGTVLKGQAELSKNSMEVAKKNMDMYQGQASAKWDAYQKALKDKNYEAAELYKKEYEAALEAAQDAEEEYLSSAEAYAEALKTVLENELAGFAQDLENALTNGTSFEQLADKMSRAKSLQEEYLTTTNKIYETNKLMNAAQMEIDKTTNTVAKNRLKQFIEETNQLQQKNKLSQFELDIQQAKYDLLLAEIALEEAQNSKSTVRLQRDAEGNFGYVYTADESKISEAEQKLADEQNKLYNISLDGANEYAEKYQQTLNEMYDTLTTLQQQYLEGAFETEQEYNDAVTAAKEYYYEKLEQYSSLHAIALQTDSRVIEEAWSKEFNTMIYSTETWKRNVTTYVSQVNNAFKTWKKDMKNLEKELGLNKIEKAVKKVTDESKSLTKELTKTGGVIDSIEDEFDAVSKVTGAWADQRKVVLALIGDYQKLANTVQNTLDTMSDDDDDDNGKPPETPSTNNPPSGGGNGGTGDGKLKVGDEVTYESGYYYYDSSGTKPLGNRGLGKKAKVTIIKEGADYPIHLKSSDSAYGWVKKSQISGYDTGGYTGDWGSEGKLAVLHEKELVLNKEDTINLLRTIELLRQTYGKDENNLESSAIFNLLKMSHGEITALYEQELLGLSKDMNAFLENNISKSSLGYNDLLNSYGSSLVNLNDEMTEKFSSMNSSYEKLSMAYEKEMNEIGKALKIGSEDSNKEYRKLVSEYSGQMLDINKTMYSQLIDMATEHKKLVAKYEENLNEVTNTVLKSVLNQSAAMGGYPASGGGPQSKALAVQELEKVRQELLESKAAISKDVMYAALQEIDVQRLNSQLGGLLNSPLIAAQEKEMKLDQQVKIEASFPNVNDRYELEEAFETLINRASQYANRTTASSKKTSSKK